MGQFERFPRLLASGLLLDAPWATGLGELAASAGGSVPAASVWQEQRFPLLFTAGNVADLSHLLPRLWRVREAVYDLVWPGVCGVTWHCWEAVCGQEAVCDLAWSGGCV